MINNKESKLEALEEALTMMTKSCLGTPILPKKNLHERQKRDRKGWRERERECVSCDLNRSQYKT